MPRSGCALSLDTGSAHGRLIAKGYASLQNGSPIAIFTTWQTTNRELSRMLNPGQWLDTLAAFYDRYGYALVFFGSLGENTALVGLFLPGSALAILGGFYARQGTLNLTWVIVLTWWAMVLGYQVDYVIGRFLLARVAKHWSATPFGRQLRLAGRLRLARALVARHGGKAILASHAIGQMRSFVALGAGASRMSYRCFLGFELVAALLWSVTFCLAGYLAGAERERLQVLLERAGWVVIALIALLYIAWRLRRSHLKNRPTSQHSRRHAISASSPRGHQMCQASRRWPAAPGSSRPQGNHDPEPNHEQQEH
jgi:membrane protein DedA with SNARE-associated domain